MTEKLTIVGDYEIVPDTIKHVPAQNGTTWSYVERWRTKHKVTGTELTVKRIRPYNGSVYDLPLRHFHYASLVIEVKQALNIKEETMQFDVLITHPENGKKSPIAGPFDEVDAQFHRKRLAEQHPESEFEVAPHPETAPTT